MARFDTALQSRMHAPHRHTRDRTIAALYQAIEGSDPMNQDEEQQHAGKVASKLCDCGRWQAIYQDNTTGELIHSQARCKHRLCPRCNAIRSERLAGNIAEHLDKLNSPRMLTLTLEHSTDELRDQVRHLVESFRRLRRSKQYKEKIRGGVAVIEIKWSNQDNAWHPHMHVLVDGVFWEQAQISKAWEIASNGSKIVDIRMIHDRSKAGRYVAKYVAKVGNVDGVPIERVPELALALKGLRLVQTSGSLYGSTHNKKEPPREEPLQHIAPLGPLADAVAGGDDEAKSVAAELRIALTCRRRADTDQLTPEDEQTCRQAARKLWDWWHDQTKDPDDEASARLQNPDRLSSPGDRSLWLWQEPEHPPGALASGR